jgi:hypothetical protein
MEESTANGHELTRRKDQPQMHADAWRFMQMSSAIPFADFTALICGYLCSSAVELFSLFSRSFASIRGWFRLWGSS